MEAKAGVKKDKYSEPLRNDLVSICKYIGEFMSLYFGDFELDYNNISKISESNEPKFPKIIFTKVLNQDKMSIIEV